MAQLIKCPVCRNMVASDAPSCPQCGTRKKPLSPGIIALFLIASLVLAASWLFPSLFYEKASFETHPGHAPRQDAARGRDEQK